MRLTHFFAAAAALLPTVGAQAQGLPMMELSMGIHRIEAEVAHTQATRVHGLMQRRSMPQQRGMLFVFDAQARHCMWMKDTLLPLSVAFIDDDGRIVNIEDMLPQTEENHCAARPVRYALEMNAGWFKSRHLGPGSPIAGIERAPAGR